MVETVEGLEGALEQMTKAGWLSTLSQTTPTACEVLYPVWTLRGYLRARALKELVLRYELFNDDTAPIVFSLICQDVAPPPDWQGFTHVDREGAKLWLSALKELGIKVGLEEKRIAGLVHMLVRWG